MPLYEFECESCRKRATELMPVGGSMTCPFCFQAMRKLPSSFSWGVDAQFTDEVKKINHQQREWVESDEVQAKLKTGEFYIDDRPDNGRSDRPEKSAMDLVREAEAIRALDDVAEGNCQSPDEFFKKVEMAKVLPQFASTGPLPVGAVT